MKMQTREDFMSYLESLRGRQFSGTVRCVFEGGKIIWVYEKSDGLPDGDLKSANIGEPMERNAESRKKTPEVGDQSQAGAILLGILETHFEEGRIVRIKRHETLLEKDQTFDAQVAFALSS